MTRAAVRNAGVNNNPTRRAARLSTFTGRNSIFDRSFNRQNVFRASGRLRGRISGG